MTRLSRVHRPVMRAAVRSVPRSIPDQALLQQKRAPRPHDAGAGPTQAPGIWNLDDPRAHPDGPTAAAKPPIMVNIRPGHASPTVIATTKNSEPHTAPARSILQIPGTSIVLPAVGHLRYDDRLATGHVTAPLPD